jgi:translation initiation factor IF-1
VPADTDIEACGVIVDVLPGSKFKIELDNGATVIAYLSGRMRMFSIKVVLGDRVQVAMSPYDLTNGRIMRRE